MPSRSILDSALRMHEFQVEPYLDGKNFVTRLVEMRGGLFQIQYGWLPQPTVFPESGAPSLLRLEAIQFLGHLLSELQGMPGEFKLRYKEWLVNMEKIYLLVENNSASKQSPIRSINTDAAHHE